MAWLLIFAFSILSWLTWNVICLLRSYRLALSIGLPMVVLPVNPFSIVWILFSRRFFPATIPILKSLPWGLGSWAEYSNFGWTFQAGYAVHQKYGDAFLVVSPGMVELFLADAAAIDAVTSRRRDFLKPIKMYKPLECFGSNVDTVEGEDWQRHRKISSPSFNERNSKLVWKEALQQAQPMLQSWMQEGRKGSIKTQQDVLTLALHVLTSAGFGLAYAFDSRDQRVQPGYSMTYGNALATVLKNLVFVFAVPHRLLLSPIAPARYRVIGEAIKDCKTYMKEFISMERRLIEKRDPGTGNLISSLVRNSDMMKFSATIADTKRRGLDEDEIYGNLFIFSLAGHETTANTLGYCIMLLAAFPQYQDWLREELTVVLGDSSPNEWDYEDTFPSLKRCLAVMYETLRLYGPVTAVPKTTKDTSQQLRLKDREILIPPGVRLELNAVGLHLNPQYWGIASAQWQPDRWIQGSNTGSESFMEPVKGSFIPWSEGPRVCPGRKFSQVEFVATIATLFQHHKVKAATLEEESSEAARSRIVRMINDSMVQGITLQMKDPQAVALVWTLFDPQ